MATFPETDPVADNEANTAKHNEGLIPTPHAPAVPAPPSHPAGAPTPPVLQPSFVATPNKHVVEETTMDKRPVPSSAPDPEPVPKIAKPSSNPSPVPEGVLPTLQKWEDGKSVVDIVPGDARNALASYGITNVGRLRRVRDIDLRTVPGLDAAILQDVRAFVPFECRTGERVLVPDKDHPGEWLETDDRENLR